MSWFVTLIIATVLAVVSYFVAMSTASAAIIAAVMAFVGVLLGRATSGGQSRSGGIVADEDQDVTTLFVGNLAFKANRHQVRDLFAEHGFVKSVRIVNDRQTRKPKGYGFVEVGTADLDRILKKINGLEFMGRELTVSVAKDKQR